MASEAADDPHTAAAREPKVLRFFPHNFNPENVVFRSKVKPQRQSQITQRRSGANISACQTRNHV